ncbi:auxin-responsive protein SAUR32-like [Olea europaea var. sylvestris]|uniref:auxin-responsive protein SAUR32-like n=1 Tax=Olea europaea var. sylvestris TaxID=158386 RepID=UPI000C1D349B|nr:auxin-responsive protein SAUR32-like [Olea europaea var. sylvestris]
MENKMQEKNKKMKVKKGCLAVSVGLEDEDGGYQRFVIPISYLHDPLFKQLLDKAREVYGYNATGPLKLPYSVDQFLHIRWQIEKEANSHSANYFPHHHHHHLALSFHSC